jgi:hypothetical protein
VDVVTRTVFTLGYTAPGPGQTLLEYVPVERGRGRQSLQVVGVKGRRRRKRKSFRTMLKRGPRKFPGSERNRVMRSSTRKEGWKTRRGVLEVP